jgi:hypothetical protein
VPRADACPCCGQTLPRDFLFVSTTSGLHLGGMQKRLFEEVSEAGPQGIHAEVLFDRLYAGRRDGGPDSGIRVVAAVVSQLNKKLKPFGKKVVAGRGLRFYSLVDLKPCAEPPL